MDEQFKNYLIKAGYKITTPSGNPSTIYSYIKSIDKVCELEGFSWCELADNIETIVKQYDLGGTKEDLGNKSHKTVINALKRFQEFINNLTNY
ncbi:MAG: hypothetical protein UH239_00065 [Acutalibacteraceae bacterium]|nr:hypothetical protein [Acutalibacteraceae bacterium]MEE1249498.1 hypothetical protein [Lachnospiraceae bacterium]